MNTDDARVVVVHGVDAIMVSNDGGCRLDGTIEPLHAPPGIVAAAPSRPVFVDGGVRRGTDVFKAPAFVGRAPPYGAAVVRRGGVGRICSILGQEIDRSEALPGCSAPGGVGLERPEPRAAA
jgi:isopentenyl diphosphate isomerase/L-lactate dehydrogenase-like FMN-dependent dehydrogenase